MNSGKGNLVARPPIVVVMGHIDHGKSKILDYIRSTNIVEGEAGGITQHIGAYEVEYANSAPPPDGSGNANAHIRIARKITFLDTPGHEAFSKMRERGAKIADIAVLVIAGDEGIKPQTLEAYETIKEAKIPFVIAINKIDKPNSDPDRVKNQLGEKQIFVEGYSGKIPVVNVSAKTGQGINDLLDMILLLAEVEDLKANPEELASGFVVESHLDPKKGIIATLLIQSGKMTRGNFVASGKSVAPVRIERATFSSPVEIIGFNEMPEAGAEFKTFETRKETEEIIAKAGHPEDRPQDVLRAVLGTIDTLSLIIKTDVSGSLEAVEKEILKQETENTKIKILRKDVGDINEDDAKLASSGKNPVILGFNVEVDNSAKDLGERFKIDIFTSDIIYKISEWFEEKIKEKEAGIKKEEISGTAKILKTFSRTKSKQVVGGKVVSGKISEKKSFKIKRGDAEIGWGKILGLQKNKTPIKEAGEGDEFGAMVETKIEILKDDELVLL